MGTRGAMGVRVNGADKITYNHFDSYPSGLGDSVVSDVRALLKSVGLDGIRAQARSLKLVDGTTTPTAEQIAHLRSFADLGVSNQKIDDWYCLTHKLQGKFAKTLESGFMVDCHDFMVDSLFCEYAYIANLDEETFEVYRGFQKQQHEKGRYANAPRDPADVARQRAKGFEYFPVALVATFSLLDIPADWEERAFPDGES